MRSLHASRRKLVVFLFAVLTIVTIFGSFMYVIEGPNNGEQFSSIPRSVYWAIVTLTTVGYGNISPASPLGQAVASFIMILGYAIVAVPTGIVTAEIARSATTTNTQSCPFCGAEGHDEDAAHCKYCGGRI
jgi:voltage-gated potassium channel